MARRFRLLYPHKNVSKIIKDRGLIVCYLDDYLIPDGAFLKLSKVTSIYINNRVDNEYELRLLYFHEIAHTILHPEISTLELRKYLPHFVEKYEKEANLFVAEYLLDDNVFEKHYGVPFTEIAQKECVTLQLVELKFNNLNK